MINQHCLHKQKRLNVCCIVKTAKAKAKEAQQAKAAVSWQMSMAAKVANLLRCIVDKALETPPAATPGKRTRLPAH